MTRSTNMEHVEVLRHMKETIKAIAPSEIAALDAAIASLSAQQPASDGGFTAADMMDARQEGRKEAQQPAAVDDDALRDARTIYDIACIREAQANVTREDVDFKAIALRNYNRIADDLRDHDQEGGNP